MKQRKEATSVPLLDGGTGHTALCNWCKGMARTPGDTVRSVELGTDDGEGSSDDLRTGAAAKRVLVSDDEIEREIRPEMQATHGTIESREEGSDPHTTENDVEAATGEGQRSRARPAKLVLVQPHEGASDGIVRARGLTLHAWESR